MGKTQRLESSPSAQTPLKLFDPQRQAYFALKKSQYLGSNPDNDITFPENPYISKTHARIHVDKSGHYVVEDLQSTNGTYVNHRPVLKTFLETGDTLTLGNTHLVLTSAHTPSAASQIETLTTRLGVLLEHPLLKHVYEQAYVFAQTKENICILGETGTGKEMLAQFIHHIRTQNQKPLLSINMSALPENLVEFELFGAKRGSFTGALHDTPGLMEQAQDGTLFLDEIGDLPLPIQPKLLRALENREVRRIGESQLRTLQCTFIFATHQNLKAKIEAGDFREDLYHRMTVLPLTLPNLEALGTYPLTLAQHLLSKPFELSPEAQQKLASLKFPGNIRELKNLLIRAQVLAKAQNQTQISPEDLVTL